MNVTTPDLPDELVSLDDLQLDLGAGRQAFVRRYRAQLHECAEKPPIGLDRAYSAKPLVLVEKQVAFPEIAILSFFKKMGWGGAWVDSQHRKFFDRMPNQSKGMSLLAHAGQAVARIAQYNNNSRVGCWDLVLWADRAVAFAAVVGVPPGADKGGSTSSEVGEARTRWIAAAMKSGLSASQFVVVEWGYRKVVARKKRNG
jgi:hypothetical protein